MNLFFRNRQKSVDFPFRKSDKASMNLRLANRKSLAATAEKVVFAMRSRLLDCNVSMIVVLIILVLLTQSGVGLTA